MPDRPAKVLIHVAVVPGESGGTATATKCLIRDLGRLTDGNEEYVVVAHTEEALAWIAPHLGPNQRGVLQPRPQAPPAAAGGSPLRRIVKRVAAPVLDRLTRTAAPVRAWPEVPLSNGYLESLGCDVLHIPTQGFFLAALPTIYNPHDLQHLHYPQYWDADHLAWRETIYPAGCHHAHTVVVGSKWIKDDVVRQYGVSPDKVQIVPEAPPERESIVLDRDAASNVVRKYSLDGQFALYPANTWPHKNHLRLLDALATLRDGHGIAIRLVCTGAKYEKHWPVVASRIAELGLERRVSFLGFVPEADLRALYRAATFLIMPSEFEASSLPVFEAWREELAVACSNAAALPDQIGDAGLLFDPTSTPEIANAMLRLATDDALRRTLRENAVRRLSAFDLDRTARAYRAVYRRAARRDLTEEDRLLLSWDWMREPERPSLSSRA